MVSQKKAKFDSQSAVAVGRDQDSPALLHTYSGAMLLDCFGSSHASTVVRRAFTDPLLGSRTAGTRSCIVLNFRELLQMGDPA